MSEHSPQPNLHATADSPDWSARFWFMTTAAGITTGLAGGALMRLLYAVEHFAWKYQAPNTLVEAAKLASSSRRILVLLVAGILVGVIGKLIRKTLGTPTELDAAIWLRDGRVAVPPTLAQAVGSIITVGLGTSLGRESAIKQAGGALASQLAAWSRLSPAETKVLVAFGVGAGMAAAYNVPVGGALFAVEVLLGSIAMRLALPACRRHDGADAAGRHGRDARRPADRHAIDLHGPTPVGR